ncbi:hypothetical protein AUJ66_08750 [Candidatus Desantisbacteria bacterium CG1_02_38_46]|uniref:Uncharacterized protein n=2 Tax=unclassified Candidatus Desantisiibacteriota TaxID=3106372 RepID=A0A1J4SC18_9BACT|nr:MAG: hypothetical protein AUJ66_08750 [Candidatus Desantisbacteria bacterium CG1_02_38_46]PIU51024.1 MAG: hypothetical protein COS91_06490 [Candidatus Desantisbacteria bacterium CG07_land_8_20_14_0_80_39_15]
MKRWQRNWKYSWRRKGTYFSKRRGWGRKQWLRKSPTNGFSSYGLSLLGWAQEQRLKKFAGYPIKPFCRRWLSPKEKVYVGPPPPLISYPKSLVVENSGRSQWLKKLGGQPIKSFTGGWVRPGEKISVGPPPPP